jgi:hypothetical protein
MKWGDRARLLVLRPAREDKSNPAEKTQAVAEQPMLRDSKLHPETRQLCEPRTKNQEPKPDLAHTKRGKRTSPTKYIK